MIKNITLLFCLSFWAVASSATFVNLDFEDYSGAGPDLFPGWEVTGTLFPQVDLIPLGTAGVSLISTSFGAIDGEYSALLNAANGDNIGISQTAMVPVNVIHISFVTSVLFPSDVTYSYTLGGNQSAVWNDRGFRQWTNEVYNCNTICCWSNSKLRFLC